MDGKDDLKWGDTTTTSNRLFATISTDPRRFSCASAEAGLFHMFVLWRNLQSNMKIPLLQQGG